MREREVQRYKAYRRVIFFSTYQPIIQDKQVYLSCRNSRKAVLLQLQEKSANDVEGTSKVSIESQPNLYHSTPFLVKNEQSTESISKSSPSQVAILIFLAKTEKTFSNSFPSQVAIYAKFGKKSLRPRIYARSYLRRIRPYQKRWKDIKIILFLSQGS